MSDSLQPHGLQHARLPCLLLSPPVCSNSCPLSRWYHPTTSFFVAPLSSCFQTFPASGPFLMSRLFTSGGQSIGASASASVLLMNIRGWFPLALIDLISLLSKGLSRVFSSTAVRKHRFFGTKPSLWSNSHICRWLLEKQYLWLYGPLLAKVCLLFNTLSGFIIAFFRKEQASFNIVAVVTIHSDFGAQENKICHCFHFFPIYLPWSMRPDVMILVFWMLGF